MAQYCSFHLGDGLYGMDILAIQEILRAQDITPVPTAPAFVAGLINLRGRIVVVADLRKRLGLPAAEEGARPIHIIAGSGGEAVSFLADRAGDVHEFDPRELRPCPGPSDPTDRLVRGVFALERGILHILDPQAVFAEAAPAAPAAP